MGRLDAESETLIPTIGGGFDVPVSFDWQAGGGGSDASFRGKSRAYIVDKPGATRSIVANRTQAIAFSAKDHGGDCGDVSPTLRAGQHDGSHANGGVMPAIAFGGQMSAPHWQYGHSDTLQAKNPKAVQLGMQVRRLTPLECERLQGFPDGWTDIPYKGKRAADGPRYKALGNSMAVNCMRWLGDRIESVERIAA